MAKTEIESYRYPIRSLSLRNFRGFKNLHRMRLAPLTFLVGPNSSGKSSLFDALLLIAQSEFIPDPRGVAEPNWGGPLVDLGSYQDTVFRHNSRLRIEIGVEVPLSVFLAPWTKRKLPKKEYLIALSYKLRASKGDLIGRLSAQGFVDVETGEILELAYSSDAISAKFLGRQRGWERKGKLRPADFDAWLTQEIKKAVSRKSKIARDAWNRLIRAVNYFGFWAHLSEVQRVSSGRVAPKRWYPVTDLRFTPRRGSFAPRLFDSVDPAMLTESGRDEHLLWPPWLVRKRRSKDTLSSGLRELEIASSIDTDRLSAYHSTINVKDSVTGIKSNLIDVGYGASQVIPVLNASLSAAVGPLFIEQPEIHLHPRAQGALANLLCRVSRDRQVVIETHSVHMVNRARIMVARGELAPGSVVVNYVSRASKGSNVQTIDVLPNGDFSEEWPGGFFDERYEDTIALLQLKEAKEEERST